MDLVTLLGAVDAGTVTALELIGTACQQGCKRHTHAHTHVNAHWTRKSPLIPSIGTQHPRIEPAQDLLLHSTPSVFHQSLYFRLPGKGKECLKICF